MFRSAHNCRFKWSRTDEAGVTQLQMLVDNQPYNQVNSQNPNGQTPFGATFVYAANSPGTHTIVIRAVDSAGNTGTSNPLTVNVNDNTPPSVTTTILATASAKMNR